jgi:site-specific DNA recombinase
MLAGLLFDAQGERMSPSHANKRGTRYRYYVSRSLIDGTAKTSIGGQRIPAVALEALTLRNVRQWLADSSKIHQLLGSEVPDATRQKRLIDRAVKFAATWKDLSAADVHAFIRAVTVRIQVHAERIEVALDRGRLLRWLDGKQQHEDRSTGRDQLVSEPDVIVLSIPVRLRRAGKEMRLVVDDGSEQPLPDPALIRLVIRAHGIRDELFHDRSLTLEEIAKSHGFVPSYATRLFRLTLLAPDIVAAVLGGRQPPELTARKLMDDTRLPLDWSEQRRALGFAQSR